MRHPTVAISLAVLAASLAAAPIKAQEGGLSDLKDFKLPGKAEAAGEAPIAGKAIGAPAASEAAQGAKAPGVYSMGEVSGEVDIAESSLRIILDKPASGKFPKAMLAGDQKLAAALRLLNIQLRFPGLLEGKHSFSFAWSQYEAVTALFRDFEKRWELFR